MKKITLEAYAKINLYLDVISKRSDGYHNIESVMQTVSLSDTVTVSFDEIADSKSIIQHFQNSDLPCDETNLCYKAAVAYFKHCGIENYAVEISVEKRIPEAAGLAGGSADAAAVIRALDLLCENNSSDEKLCEIGLDVGSDVPFCIIGGTCAVTGRGESVEKIKPLTGVHAVIAKSANESVHTKEAYNRIDSNCLNSTPSIPFDAYISAVSCGDISTVTKGVYNIFQEVMSDVLVDTFKIIGTMKKSGALCSMMSGSGPSVFGIFKTKELAEKACEDLKKCYFATLCELK